MFEKALDGIGGRLGLKAIIGSAFLWAWLDAIFMSRFFLDRPPFDLYPEYGSIAVFASSIAVCAVISLRSQQVARLMQGRRANLAWGVAGVLASALLVVAGATRSPAALVAGGALGGCFIGLGETAWGALYAREGAGSATVFVSGAFAFAIILDIPLLFMTPVAAAVFFALFPFASAVVFSSIDPLERRYPVPPPSSVDVLSGSGGRMAFVREFKNHLGLTIGLLGAVMLVMVGFGFMQHLVSFSSAASIGTTDGVLIQVIRGMVGVVLFVVLVAFRAPYGIVYSIGLLFMIAGFMLMPFLFGTGGFWVAGAVIIGGYTSFDLLIWVVFSQIACFQSRSPINTIDIKIMVVSISYVAGAVLAIALVGDGSQQRAFIAQEVILVGYLVTIATVLLLRSGDIWALFSQAPLPCEKADDAALEKPGDAADAGLDAGLRPTGLLAGFGFTPREMEVAEQLANGRTLPWIAEHLSISMNTVSTHVRHIYQKMDVHDRQDFIDAISQVSDPSRDSRDGVSSAHR